MTLPRYGQPIVRLDDIDLSNLSIAGEVAGDLITFDGAQWNRLPVGAEDDVLTVTGGIPTWNATLTNITLAGALTAAGATWTDLGTVVTVDINGGTIDGTSIGAAAASTIVGTTIDATTDFTIGATVITDGVLTDAGGFQIAAVLDMADNGINNIGASANNFGATQLDLIAGFTILGANGLTVSTTAGDLIFTPSGNSVFRKTATSITFIIEQFATEIFDNQEYASLDFRYRNAAAQQIVGASIVTKVLDVSSGTGDTEVIFETEVAGTKAARAAIGQGLVVGAPTDGDKGVGTINATGVFDDGVLLTDYVFEPRYKMLPVGQMVEFFERERHLPTIPGRQEWERRGQFSLGQLATHLWETAEVHARYIGEYEARSSTIEDRVAAVEEANSILRDQLAGANLIPEV